MLKKKLHAPQNPHDVRHVDVRSLTEALAEALKIKAASQLAAWCQVRRCHRCGETHEESGERVVKCSSCGAHFAPFFFAELTPQTMQGANTAALKPEALAFSSTKNYRAVVGVTWWWLDSADAAGEQFMPRA